MKVRLPKGPDWEAIMAWLAGPWVWKSSVCMAVWVAGVGSLGCCTVPPPVKSGWANFIGRQRWVWGLLRGL